MVKSVKKSYLDIIENLNIHRGDTVYLSTELLKLMWLCKNSAEQFNADLLLNVLQDKIGTSGTLMIPTYNFDFSNNGFYDIRHSRSTVGYIGNVALSRNDFKRTKHPIHSFAVWGKDQELLCHMKNSDSFDCDSPFQYLYDNHGIEIGLGLEYAQGFTFIHYIECMAQVPYRFNKVFKGTYIDEKGDEEYREYDYPARDRAVSFEINEAGLKEILETSGAAESFMFEGVHSYRIDLAKCYMALYKEIKENRCKRIFDFSMDRDFLFSTHYEVHKD